MQINKESILNSSLENSAVIARELKQPIDLVEDVLIDKYYNNFIITKAQLKSAAKNIYISNIRNIAADFKTTDVTLRKYFDICKLYYPKKSIFEEKQIIPWQELITKYSEGSSLGQLEQEYKINRKAISKKFKELNISTSKITFNDTLFNKIDSEEKAYWLGFFYADGALSLKENAFEVSLKLSDTNHLIKLKEFFKAKRNIRYQYKGIQRCRLSLQSKSFKDQLINLGCIPQKSLVLKFPTEEQVPREFIIPFIRGYFDGDGCITYAFRNKKKKVITPRLTLLGTEDFLKGCMNYLPITNLIKANKNGANECKEAKWNKEDSIKILNLLYNNANIYLYRKYERYICFKNNNFAVLLSDFQDNDRAISVKSKQIVNQYFNIDIDKLLQDNTEIN
jgi:hypothetical protein